ncbi:MAG: hypothetical protein PHX20_00005, partial [Candidatus Omnitrophica bacterium]|nr:hypothetical protein [Candidatus Omnitrophota bacterium]
LGPALRYKWLEKYALQKEGLDVRYEKILVCLSMLSDINYEMLDMVARAGLPPDLKILVKPHPMTDPEELKRRVPFLRDDRVSIISGGIEKWIPTAKVVIVGQSSSMVESVFFGARTVVVGRRTDIDVVPLDIVEEDDSWKLVSNPGELRAAVDEFCSKGKGDHRQKDGFFEFNMGLLDDLITAK